MNAQEMFEELGYEESKMIKDNKILLIKYTIFSREITFDLQIKKYFIWGNDYVNWYCIKEHQAINQQMIELGWLDEPKTK